jgi:phage baseplate assembly protein W
MAASDRDAPYLGTGWSFPPRFDPIGGAAMTSGADDVAESLRILVGTRLGERIMLPVYGLPLEPFDNLTLTVQNAIKTRVRNAVVRYEPRVTVLTVDVLVPQDGREGEVLIRIDYEIPTVNARSNMVFPYYLSEGNLVRVPPDRSAGGGP